MSTRGEFLAKYNQGRTFEYAQSLVRKMSLGQIVELSDSHLDKLSKIKNSGLPLKRMRTRGRVFCAVYEVYRRLQDFETVVVK